MSAITKNDHDHEKTGQLVQFRGDPALTAVERNICEQLIIKGPSYFSELAWTMEQVGQFLGRANVKIEMERLKSVVTDGEGIMARQQFMARFKLGEMYNKAVLLVMQALNGGEKSPTDAQYRAAMDTLNMIGVTQQQLKTLVQTGALDALSTVDPRVVSQENEDKGKYDIIKVLQRERVRNTVLQILTTAAQTDIAIESMTDVQNAQEIRKKVRKKRRSLRDR